MNETSDEPGRSLREAITRLWHRVSRNWGAVRELNNLDKSTLQEIASDVNCDVNELRTLAGRWPESADLLPRRMNALHLDPKAFCSEQPQIANDLRKHCSLCAVRGQCEHDLDKRPSDPVWQRYCPNTMTLLAVTKAQSDSAESRKVG